MLEEGVLAALARGDAVGPRALQFLLRRYHTSGSTEIAAALGPALAAAIHDAGSSSSVDGTDETRDTAAALELFVDAAGLTDDDRLVPAMRDLIDRLRPAWRHPPLSESAAALRASLLAAAMPPFHGIAADAIDALEETVGAAYRPGEQAGSDADQVQAASALLTAYSLCGRLPYPMLAEELIYALRDRGMMPFVDACEAARVLCRLAVLHDDPDYRAAAIVAPHADYRRDAERLLDRLSPEAGKAGTAAAIYGLAVLELESRPFAPQSGQSTIHNPQSTIDNPKSNDHDY
jgi:hypothetical protein